MTGALHATLELIVAFNLGRMYLRDVVTSKMVPKFACLLPWPYGCLSYSAS